LSKKWAEAFPDPRAEPEIGMEVILPAHLAGRFAGLYSLRKTDYVLRSARVLGALGYRVEVVEPEQGLSLRDTSDDPFVSGDGVRKLLVKMEPEVDPSQPAPILAKEPSVAVKVRERASRRAVKQAVNEAEAEVRAPCRRDQSRALPRSVIDIPLTSARPLVAVSPRPPSAYPPPPAQEPMRSCPQTLPFFRQPQ
jgi:hypothetical protein